MPAPGTRRLTLPPCPCYQDLEKQTAKRRNLYRKRAPPGECVSSNTKRPPQPDHPPIDEELRQAANNSSNETTGRATNMRADDLNEWQQGTENKEKARRKG